MLKLLQKEFTLELRRKAVLAGIVLFLVSLTFICYLTFGFQRNALNEWVWSALFWLVILFAVINSVAKSFIGEKSGVMLYYYTMASPQNIILSKIVYNFCLSIALTISAYLLFKIFIYSPIEDHLIFIPSILLTSLGFSSALTLMSAIASKTRNANVIMAVLSFPILIGVLLMAIKITKNVLDGLDRSASYDELFNLVAINCILTALAYILFPYIWRS